MESIKQFLSTKYRLSTSNGFFSFFQNKFSMNSRRRSKIESVRIQQKAKCPEAPAFTSKSLAEINEKFNDCQYGMIYQHEKKTLIFDLDRTLIFASRETPQPTESFVQIEKGRQTLIKYIIPRPGLLEFLKGLSKIYNICILTSADEIYAKRVVEETGISKYIYTLYDRAFCKKVNDNLYLKNIWALGFRQEQTVFIDDFEKQMECQPNNSIRIKRFEGEESDRELYTLYSFLEKLNKIDDVRPVSKYLSEHLSGNFKIQRCDSEYYDGCQLEFDEGYRMPVPEHYQ